LPTTRVARVGMAICTLRTSTSGLLPTSVDREATKSTAVRLYLLRPPESGFSLFAPVAGLSLLPLQSKAAAAAPDDPVQSGSNKKGPHARPPGWQKCVDYFEVDSGQVLRPSSE